MAHLSIDFYSKSVMRITNMKVIIPNDLIPVMREGNKAYERPMGLLILLHGFSGASMDWITGSRVQELAITYNLMVVMPSGDNSFYLNGKGADMAYEDLIAKEIPEYLRKTFCMDFGPENTYIGGLSMGGFGAIHTGLKYPEVFGKIFALSSALIVNQIAGLKPEMQDPALMLDYDYYERCFGNLEQLKHSENDPEFLIKKHMQSGSRIPDIYMACGTEDFLLKENREFRDFLIQNKIMVDYHESQGIHDWKFWNQYLEPAICWMTQEEKV